MRRSLALVAVAAVTLLGCDNDTVEDVREEAEDIAGTTGARAAAEAMRTSLETRDLDPDQTLLDVEVLEDAASDIPGDPDVTGIDDRDGDGQDDDGYVEIGVGDQSACVTVEENGEVGVDNDACPAGEETTTTTTAGETTTTTTAGEETTTTTAGE